MTHDNVTDIVERLREMAPSHPPDLIWGERSTRDLSNDIREAADQIEAQQAELAALREVITEANNSLYGSHNFFLSLDGGPPNKYHLAEGIEKLKSNARRLPKGQRDEVR